MTSTPRYLRRRQPRPTETNPSYYTYPLVLDGILIANLLGCEVDIYYSYHHRFPDEALFELLFQAGTNLFRGMSALLQQQQDKLDSRPVTLTECMNRLLAELNDPALHPELTHHASWYAEGVGKRAALVSVRYKTDMCGITYG